MVGSRLILVQTIIRAFTPICFNLTKSRQNRGLAQMSVISNLARFRRDERGTTALLFGLVLFVCISVAGLCFDMARAHRIATKVSGALDSAALAAAKAMMENDGLSDTQIKDIAIAFLNTQTANLASAGLVLGTPVITLDRSIGEVRVVSNVSVATTFGRILTIDSLDFSRGSTVIYNPMRIELAMVLDVTGSMLSGGKMDAMKAAAKDIINTLVDPSKPYLTRVALVPYSAAVNVGVYKDIASGGDSLDGCIMERLFEPNRDNDTAPGFPNNFAVMGQLNSPYNSRYVCPDAVLHPLSADRDSLKATIDSYSPSGYTAGHIGIAWGWNVISPNWTWVFTGNSAPAPYSDVRYRKVVIILTDGQFNTSYTGTTDNAGQIDESQTRALALCSAMKAKNITIYTIAVQSPPEAQALLNSCATSNNHSFDVANNTQLHDAFMTIAMQLQRIRVSK
jgi:Flp pilus assembly protein TadG